MKDLLFYDDNFNPRRLFVLSQQEETRTRLTLPLSSLREECRLEVDVVEENGVSVAALEPSQLSSMVANHFCLTALQTNAFGFAVDDQDEGVCLFKESLDSGEHIGFVLSTIVVSMDGNPTCLHDSLIASFDI